MDQRLTDLLRDQWYQFGFFQAVRLLSLSGESPDGPRRRRSPAVGSDASPQDELVRVKGWPSRSFPATEICGFEQVAPDEDGRPPRCDISVSFMGLYGPAGVLPSHYTQQVITETRREKATPLRDFYDLFNHRALSLFYRAWEKYRFYVGFERARQGLLGARQDDFSAALLSLVGLGTPSVRDRLEFPDDAVVHYGGVYSRYPRNAMSLQRVLVDALGIPVDVQQFQGQWLQIEPGDKSQCPSAERPKGTNCALGVNAVAGDRVWTVEDKFRLRLGPLGASDFARFMPGEQSLIQLAQFARQYVGPCLDFDVQVILQAEDVPACYMDSRPDACFRPQLGFNTWLLSRPSSEDKHDAVFRHDGYPITDPGG